MLTSRLLALVCLGPSMAVSNAWAGDLHVPTDYPTVQSAIHAAAAGDVIRLAPGTYQGTVVVEKGGISIVGAGAESTALVSDGAPWAVVVSSCGLGEADLVRLVGCRIRGIGGGGVVAGGSRLVVQDCVVADSPDVALQANDAARVLASRCEFAGNGYGAKQGGADTELRLTDSVLTANTYGACAVGSGGRLVAERCTVSGNHAGVFIYAAGRCALTDCSVSSNAWVGVAMGGYGGPGGCDLDVAGGEIASNGSDGITCADGSRVTIGQGVATSGTRMTANGQSAIACSGGSTATVVDAELSGSPWAGVSCEGASHASLEDCRLAGNYAGIWANGESSVAADRCTIADSDYYGAACLAGSTLSLRSSTLEGAPFGAYFSLATGEVTGSTLAGNAVYGIVCSGSSPLLANNTVEGNGYAGILNTADWGPDFEPGTADDGPLANPRISGNTIGGNAGGGIANYDTRPANADTLAADNTFGDDNGPFRIAQLWLGRARVVSGGVGVDGAAVTAMDAAGRIVTLVTGAGGYSSWGWFTQYRVYNDSAREDMNPYTVTASSGSTNRTVTYAWDGLPKPYGADVNGRYQTAIVELGAPPAITDVTGPAAPVSVGATVSAQARFTDPDAADTHVATWAWGDGTTSSGTVSEPAGDAPGHMAGHHVYAAPGVYTVTASVMDAGGLADERALRFVVVYDPDGGFVTGGGWIASPVGAHPAAPSLTGKASFGFNSKYRKGAGVPTGTTEFQFRAANLSFHSDTYEWLVVAGARARYKGTGTINNAGAYGFMLTATDGQLSGGGGTDRFRIKIWDRASGDVIYDNQMGAEDDAAPTTALGGGSIVVHRGEAVAASPAGVAQIAGVSAVPTRGGAQVSFTLSTNAEVSITIRSLAGRPVRTLIAQKAFAAGTRLALWNAQADNALPVPNGRYLVEVTARSVDGSQSRALATVSVRR